LGTRQGRAILPWILLLLMSGGGRRGGDGFGGFGGGFGGFGGGMSGGGGSSRGFWKRGWLMSIMQKKPEAVFRVVTDDCSKIFGSDLISIILYGSGARADYAPERSDLNFMIVLTEQGMTSLDRVMDAVKRWQKHNVATPLFITKSYIVDSLDSYPIEFLNIKRRYKIVHGEDLLLQLSFDSKHIRLQIERELRGKLLHLRSGWLETQDKAKNLRKLIAVSLTTFVSLFCALLYMKRIEIPEGNNDVITAAGAAFGFDVGVFLDCEKIHRGSDNFSSDEMKAVFRKYLKQIEQLCNHIDQLRIEE
jgi:predicted nucleotidyltransferase